MMALAMRWDGIELLALSLMMVLAGQSYHRWRFRVPIFALAYLYFAQAVNLLGLPHFMPAPSWFWLRIAADGTMIALVGLYLWARQSHPVLLR